MPLITRPTGSAPVGDVEHTLAVDDVAQALQTARYPYTVLQQRCRPSSSLDSKLTTALASRDATEPCRYRTRRLGTAYCHDASDNPATQQTPAHVCDVVAGDGTARTVPYQRQKALTAVIGAL
jgi:hypothetical protein